MDTQTCLVTPLMRFEGLNFLMYQDAIHSATVGSGSHVWFPSHAYTIAWCRPGRFPGEDKVSGTVMLRLGGRQAVRGRFLGSWDSPGDEFSLPGGTITVQDAFTALGYGVLDSAMVATAAYCLVK
jgi:hypothetical protein